MTEVVSLFSGCGGLDIGFQMSNFKIIWANENDKMACQIYRDNLHENIICEDVSKVQLNDVPDCDVLIGGPPCQAFSMIGKRDVNDRNFNLVWNFLSVLKKKQPDKFLIENVTGLKSAMDGNGDKVLELLVQKIESLGYSVTTATLNAADYGVPQRRKRLFIMGTTGSEKIEIPKPTHTAEPSGTDNLKKWVSVEDAISDLPEATYDQTVLNYTTPAISEYQKWARKNSTKVYNHKIPRSSELDMKIIKHVKEGGNYMDVPDSIPSNRIRKYKITGGRTTTYGRLKRSMPAYTINTYFDRPNVGCNIHYSQDRLITLREGLRLQSFPDSFVLDDDLTKRVKYKVVGNAVPPLLALALSKSFKE